MIRSVNSTYSAIRRVSRSAITAGPKGRTCVHTPILGTLRRSRTYRTTSHPIHINDLGPYPVKAPIVPTQRARPPTHAWSPVQFAGPFANPLASLRPGRRVGSRVTPLASRRPSAGLVHRHLQVGAAGVALPEGLDLLVNRPGVGGAVVADDQVHRGLQGILQGGVGAHRIAVAVADLEVAAELGGTRVINDVAGRIQHGHPAIGVDDHPPDGHRVRSEE